MILGNSLASNIIVRQSQLEDSMGGGISYRTPQLFDDTITIELTPEEAFFSTEVYRGLYLQNSTRGTQFVSGDIKEISLISIGGMGLPTVGGSYEVDPRVVEPLVEEARDRLVDMVDQSGAGVIPSYDSQYDVTKLTFYDWLYDRYKRNLPPINPDSYTISAMEVDYQGKDQYPDRQEFENLKAWFSLNILIPAPTKASLFDQIKTEVYIPGDRVLAPISENTESLPFGKISRTLPYLTEYKYQDVGSYWGFLIKISVDFIPDWEIISDSSLVIIRWTDSNNQEHSKTIRVIVNGNMGNLNDLNNNTMEALYGNYPPYFRYYNED